MPTPTFTLGRDAQLVVLGPYGRLDLNVTEFKWQEHTHDVMSRPLHGHTQIAYLPDYCSGSFQIDRNSNVVETLASQRNQQFYSGAAITTGTLYAYITEINGTVTVLQWNQVVFKVSDGGTYKSDDAVKVTLEWAGNSVQVVA